MNDLTEKIENLRKAYSEKKVQIEPPKVKVYEYMITDTPSILIYFAPGVELIEAERSLRDRYRERFITVREKNADSPRK